MAVALNKFCAIGASVIGLLVWGSLAAAQAAESSKTASKAAQTKCEGTEAPGTDAPTPADPYPLNAAGWGRKSGMDCFPAIGLRTGQACVRPAMPRRSRLQPA
jgi:hypothetical protein